MDEKNQDTTELTGDIDYREIAEHGPESEPRASHFDGGFNSDDRGHIQFIEVSKLDVAFLRGFSGPGRNARSNRSSSPRPKSMRSWPSRPVRRGQGDPGFRVETLLRRVLPVPEARLRDLSIPASRP